MINPLSRWVCFVTIAVALVTCGKQVPVFHDTGSPQRLSEWNLFALNKGFLTPTPATLVFEPGNPLFTDYASKLRTMWLSGDERITLDNNEFEYPVGTILSKTFYYREDSSGYLSVTPDLIGEETVAAHGRLLETRLLVHRSTGWQAFPYIWNQEQTEAFLRVAGGSVDIDLKKDSADLHFTYFVPNENQCAGCHVTEHPDGEIRPLGATYSQLGRSNLQQSVIGAMQENGWLEANTASTREMASWRNTELDLDTRAKAYLKIHCGHCHNREGAADTSALILDGSAINPVETGVCKPPVAAGGGAGDLLYGIVPGQPQQSILLFRMESNDPAVMMPELGRSLIHLEGVELIRQWIRQMPGDCN